MVPAVYSSVPISHDAVVTIPFFLQEWKLGEFFCSKIFFALIVMLVKNKRKKVGECLMQ